MVKRRRVDFRSIKIYVSGVSLKVIVMIFMFLISCLLLNQYINLQMHLKKWLQHVQRMDTNRLPKQALQYRPKGRRNIGRPKKRWRDQLHFDD